MFREVFQNCSGFSTSFQLRRGLPQREVRGGLCGRLPGGFAVSGWGFLEMLGVQDGLQIKPQKSSFFRAQLGSVRWFCSISLGPNDFEPHHTHVRRCLESFSVPRWAFFARTWAHACGLESSSLNHWLPCPEHKISPKARWHVWNLNSLSDLGAGINRPLWLEPADYIETFGALWLLFWFR